MLEVNITIWMCILDNYVLNIIIALQLVFLSITYTCSFFLASNNLSILISIFIDCYTKISYHFYKGSWASRLILSFTNDESTTAPVIFMLSQDIKKRTLS